MAEQLFEKRSAEREKRKKIKRQQLSETWLFVCEGSKTEPNYVKSLVDCANTKTKTSKLKIDVKGEGKNTKGLVKSVDDLLADIDGFNTKTDIPYGKVFVLFDKDSFKAENFDNAIKMAQARGYIPIWSNECFELWYILHFDYLDADIGRELYFKKLSNYLCIDNYEKEKSIDVFSIIHSPGKIGTALRHAEKLHNQSENISSYAKRVPCTQVFLLIRELEKRLRIKLDEK